MPSSRAGAIRAVLVGVVLVGLFSFFFVFPGHDPKPNHVPVGVTGPGAEQVAAGLGQGDRFEVRRLRDPAAARREVLDRDIYGALVTGPQPRLLVATAASPQVAAILEAAAARAAPPGSRPRVEDVRPLDKDDPRGVALNLTLLPLAVTSILGALLLNSLAPGLRAGPRLLALAAFGVLGGLVCSLIVRVGIEALPGPFLGLWGVAALAIFAAAAPAAAIMRALGEPGVGLSFLIFLMLGNPASGAASAPQLLPDPWREGGQFLPAGAAATALRNVAYFDGAALLKPLLVLIIFAAVGAIVLFALDRRRPASAKAPVPAPAQA
jgi:hypothetical protein